MPGAVIDMSPSLGPVRRSCTVALASETPARGRHSATGFPRPVRWTGRSANRCHGAGPRLYRDERCTSRVRLGGELGMPSASFGGGALRVRVPPGYDASSATDRSDRGLPADPRTARRAALVEAL